jgi:3-oxoacyl-[acyl-carrier-protein] synthase-3
MLEFTSSSETSAAIVSAAVCTDTDTGSYFELATRAGNGALAQAGVLPDQVGMVINAGIFRDSNISEPAVAALIQKRLAVGLEYATGRLPVFSFDIMHGAIGVVHALTVAQSFLSAGDVEYVLIVAGETHPSTDRTAADFPFHIGAGALLVRATAEAGGFGSLYVAETSGSVEPTAWVNLAAAGTQGRSALTVNTAGGDDPLDRAVAVTRACLADAGLDRDDFASGGAVLLAPAPVPGFSQLLADALDLPGSGIAGVDPALGDPHTAAPVHSYLTAMDAGLLETARTVVFLAADASSAACLTYHPQPLALLSPVGMRAKHVDV